MNIGEVAQASGVQAKMIRYYESIGLIGPIKRSASGYRLYGERDVEVLRFVRQARATAIPVAQIRQLLELRQKPGRSSVGLRALAQRHAAELQRRIDDACSLLAALRALSDNRRPHACPT